MSGEFCPGCVLGSSNIDSDYNSYVYQYARMNTAGDTGIFATQSCVNHVERFQVGI